MVLMYIERRAVRLIVYVWIGFVFGVQIFLSSIGAAGPVRESFTFTLVLATLLSVITIGTYASVSYIYRTMGDIEEARKQRILQQFRKEGEEHE